MDTEIDALLTLIPGQGDVGAPMLRGDVRVLRGAYRGTVSLPALVAFNRAPVAADDASDYLDALRLDIAVSTEEDLVVDNKVLIEVKAIDQLLPVHQAQVITYLKLTGLRTALLINFNVHLLKDGLKRISL